MNDSQTVNFTITFFKPYNIGLLTKKSDFLKCELKVPLENNTAFYEGLYLGNATEIRMAAKSNETQKIRMEIIFDTRDPIMKIFRAVASKMYFVIIGLIAT